jgi:hypothetical protein
MPDSRRDRILAETNTPVVTTASPAYHPDVLAHHAADCIFDNHCPAESGLSAARRALCTIYKGNADIAAAHKESLRSVTTQPTDGRGRAQGVQKVEWVIPEEAAAPLAEAMQASLQRNAQEVEAAKLQVMAAIGTIQDTIKKDTTHPAAERASVVAECDAIRKYVAALDSVPARVFFLQQAAQTGDLTTIHAVFNARPFLSGITQKEIDLLRPVIDEAFSPMNHKQQKILLGALDTISKAAIDYGVRFKQKMPVIKPHPESAALKRLAG